ncbi:MAG TPA: chemotaxis response regulator protein-glutamate methylesterase [Actinomycetales bacterium]
MPPIRVLVVDDSVVVRRLVADVLAGDPDIDVIGTASNGQLALTKIAQMKPDLVTFDIEMPVMDGVTAVRALRASGSTVPVIMFSTLTERGASATLDALEAGASDYVTKPASAASLAHSLEQVRAVLVPKIRALVPRRGAGHRPPPPARATAHAAPPPRTRPPATSGPAQPAARRTSDAPFQILAIGCSTGGPDALTKVLTTLPADLTVPVVVVQHMPPVFTKQFAARLDRNLPLTVVEASGGETLRPGHVYIAPGDFHLRVTMRGMGMATVLDQGEPENFCRPAVDVLFTSVATAYRGNVLGVVLTGMGQDGRRGSQQVVTAGGSVIVQDEPTSVVWGMPGSVANAGLAEDILPLADIGATIMRRLANRPAGTRVPALGGAR